ncbi:carbamoylphosphate synthase large subunit [Poronia punctata]|nr:carbamoylphosphate synthase large subunit [Poronia punctata]
MTGSTFHDTTRCFALILLSLLILPLSLTILLLTCPQSAIDKKTILVTGIGMSKGLTLARAFHLSGHRVIGADFEDGIIPCPGRFSKSISRFYTLPGRRKNYISLLVGIVEKESVDLWVSCSGVTSAIEDALAKKEIESQTRCKCVQFDEKTTAALHCKDEFTRVCAERGLSVPRSHRVCSAGEEERGKERRYILKPTDVNDIYRANMTLLPLPTPSQTSSKSSSPWILQEYIGGKEEYCTHSLVVRGEIKCFVACPSQELLMHYVPLQPTDARWRAMRKFTEGFLERWGNGEKEMLTGHLSFDFMAKRDEEDGVYAIECNPRAHTAVVLFGKEVVEGYLSVLDTNTNTKKGGKQEGKEEEELLSPSPLTTKPRYWIGHDLITLIIHPLFTLSMDFESVKTFFQHVFTWKEGTFESWDPLPALVLYHVYWPLTILSAWWGGRRWSRVNVSTTKMFSC